MPCPFCRKGVFAIVGGGGLGHSRRFVCTAKGTRVHGLKTCNMTTPCITLEDCLKTHTLAPPDRQREGLEAWHAALTGGTPKHNEELRVSLKEIARRLGKHPATLWRLGVPDNCGESYSGGRKVYLLQEVLVYLRSPACAARREELRGARRKQGKEAA